MDFLGQLLDSIGEIWLLDILKKLLDPIAELSLWDLLRRSEPERY